MIVDEVEVSRTILLMRTIERTSNRDADLCNFYFPTRIINRIEKIDFQNINLG